MPQHIPKLIDDCEGYDLYFSLSETIPWQDGIKTRYGGFTRKGYSLQNCENKGVDNAINTVMLNFGIKDVEVMGVYLNFYKNGEYYCPNHSHKDSRQIIISLGVTRKLIIDKQSYLLSNGDAILFGSEYHSVPKEPNLMEGRISIAIFLTK